ncbi:MAG: hybrid sensor histidine kinase/response regulator [Bacteroidota bacterium]|nr:hybrid sensor histidine kinase/response regulator [Bacteroidota bacterium]
MTKDTTLLVVDDNVTNLKLLGNILKKEGYRLAFAKNGKDAITLSQKTKPDLILLDIMMPEMDGYEVCTKLKSDVQTAEIPVIFLTAKSETDDVVEGFNIGGVDYITKPFKKDELLVRINTHVELKKANEQIREQAVELKKINETKDRLFSIISHDLRGPLGGIKNMVDLLISEYREDIEFTGKSLEILKRSADKTRTLLENLLFWSRSQRGEINRNPKIINVKSIVNDIILLSQSAADDKKILLKSEIEQNVYCFADSDMIKTVIRNLVNNAIKFTNKNGEISISAQNTDNKIIVYVKDNGIGISKQNIDKILSENVYFTSYGTGKEKGSGLGINLCIDFVKRNNGELNIESTEGEGSIFSFSLPIEANE